MVIAVRAIWSTGSRGGHLGSRIGYDPCKVLIANSPLTTVVWQLSQTPCICWHYGFPSCQPSGVWVLGRGPNSDKQRVTVMWTNHMCDCITIFTLINYNQYLLRRTPALPLAVWASRNFLQVWLPEGTGQIIVIVCVCIVSLYHTCSFTVSPLWLWPLGPDAQARVVEATWEEK